MTLIGLTGYAGSGKDTVAEILVREHGFRRYAFADKLRELVYEINPPIVVGYWSIGSELYDRTAPLKELVDRHGWDFCKREFPHVRELLQRVGVWHRENVDENFWVKLLENQWRSDGFYNKVVITDVRFPNEAEWVTNYNGHVFRVTRPGVGPVNGHVSEKLDFEADYQIDNAGDIDDLALYVDRLVREIS